MRMVAMEAVKVIYCCSVLLLLATVNGHGTWASQLSIEHEGDIYDCVDINKQPSLNHSLLKNHRVQMKPSGSFSESTIDDDDDESLEIGLGEGCPVGTVPILRAPKEDLEAASKQDLFKSYARHGWGFFRAEEQTIVKPNSKHYGVQAHLNVYNPKVIPQEEMYVPQSNVVIKLFFGHYGSGVGAGWAVDPYTYSSNSTRFHAFWLVGYNQKYCANTKCQGFIQVSRKIPVGMKISNVSTYHGKQYDIKLTIYKDPKRGYWWLLYGSKDEPVGYWPTNLFKNETITHAKQALWGGTAAGRDPFPPMGSGHNPKEGYASACYISRLKVLETSGGKFTDIKTDMLTKFETSPTCYTVGGQGYSKKWGYRIFVGGAGGLCGL